MFPCFPLRRVLRLASFCLAFICSGLALPPCAMAVETSLVARGADKNLQIRLQEASASLALPANSDAQTRFSAALSDYRTLVQVLYDAGYFAPVVQIRLDGREAAFLHPTSLPQSIKTVAIQVAPGSRFVFGNTQIAPLPKGTAVDLPAGFAQGHPANTRVLKETLDAGIQAWRYAGHAKASLGGQNLIADHRSAQLHARLRLAPGPRLTFGRLHLTGKSEVSARAIQRIAGFPTGEQFHPDLVTRSAGRLRRTGTFSSISLQAAEHPNPDGSLDFTAQVEDLPKRRLSFGAMLNSSTGLEINGAWMHRNLFGNAEKLRIEALVGGIGGSNDLDGRIALRLDQPARLKPDDSLFYLLDVENLDEEHYTALQGRAGLGVRRVFSDHLFAEVGIGATSILANDTFGKRRFKYASGFLRLEYDRRNNAVDASSGYFLDARARPFFGLDGRDSGLQMQLDGRVYHGLGGSDSIVLAGRMQIGSVIGPSLQETAPTLLFFSGGAGSVRGHEYQSLGIPNGTEASGGRGYLALSGEIRAKLNNKLSLVGFADLGFLDSDSFVSSSSQKHAGAGLGLRYDISGIGPLRVDLAYPVNGGSADGLQFYIGVGQAF